MASPDAVILPADEMAARASIVAWLGYPASERQRETKLEQIHQLWRNRLGLPLAGRNDATFKARTESALQKLSRMVDRQLWAGEIFRRQVLARQDGYNGFFGETDDNELARQMSDYRTTEAQRRDGHDGRKAYGNFHRDYWRSRIPSLALAVGACAWWPPSGVTYQESRRRGELRPSLNTLLFTHYEWAALAISEAERFRKIAKACGHKEAENLIEFRLVGF